MCSISGFISSQPIAKKTASRLCSALLFYGSVRGSQSSGIWINNHLLKKAESPDDFIYSPEFSNVFDRGPTIALMHTRQPTSGGLGDAQAQPFKVGNTVTVHNGYFHNITELKNKWSIQKKSGVDSELVTQFIESYGINMLPKFLASSEGPSAFAIHHNGELYLMRDTNPIHVANLDMKNGTKLTIFASTADIIHDALKYCWLIESNVRANMIKEGILFHLNREGVLEKLSEKTSSKFYSRVCRGHSSYSSCGDNYPHWWKEKNHGVKDIESTYEKHRKNQLSIEKCYRSESD